MRMSPIHDFSESLGAKFTDFGGWSMPLHFDSIVSEHMSVRQAQGWFDVSHLGRFRINGPASSVVVSRETTIDPEKLAVGSTTYGLVLTPAGGIADDIVVWRLGDEDFVVLPNAANHAAVMERFVEASPIDLRETTVMLAVQGPDAPATLEGLSGFGGKRFTVEEHESLLVAGTGYTGERGGELIFSVSAAPQLVSRLIEREVAPCGLGARDTLRLEAGLPLWGQDMDENTSPFHAGLRFAVDLDHDFIGKDALDVSEPSGRVLFTTGNRRIPRAHQLLLNADGDEVGEVTSGSFSPVREEGIGMGLLTVQSDTLAVDIRGTTTPVQRVRRSFL